MPRLLLRHAVVSTAFILTSFPLRASAEEITVFAAASLKNALDAVALQWREETGNMVTISYAGSSQLAAQIEEGAPADLFVSAAVNWMDILEQANLIKPGTRRDLLGNTLVLVGHGAQVAPVEIGPNFNLAGLLGGGKLSMALVDSVPSGQYGKAALESLGVWSVVESSVAQSENVRAALALVASGEAPYGIVYGSDALADDEAENQVSVVGTFPEDSHDPIVYPAAVVASSREPEAEAFLDYLSSDEADAIFAGQGFSILN